MKRSTRFVPAVLASLALGLLAPSARAAGAETTQTTEQLANEAYELHAAGKYPQAIATYLKAYEISKAGVILLNVATIYDRKMHERALAAEYYRRYLLAPDADPDRVKKANERLSALKAEAEAEEAAKRAAAALPQVPATAPPPAQPAPAPEAGANANAEGSADADQGTRAGPVRTAGVVIGVVGAAGVATSLVLGVIAKGKNDDANAVCNGTACTTQRGVTLAKDAGTFATASTVAFIGGLALVGTGISMYFLSPKRTSSAQSALVTIAPTLDRSGERIGGAEMSIHGSF